LTDEVKEENDTTHFECQELLQALGSEEGDVAIQQGSGELEERKRDRVCVGEDLALDLERERREWLMIFGRHDGRVDG
jgi:hypothetical protein